MYYQPIVSLADGNIIGVESLIRWEHPQSGLVSPAEFIPLAEETGMIEPIGRWVIKEALSQNKIWHDAGYSNTSLSVNVSARQFRSHNLPEVIQRILEETGMNSKAFDLEITESSVMEEIAKAIIQMAHGLNKKVVAEGVETEAQLEFLRSHNCDMAQGYLFGKPMPANELVKVLQKNTAHRILSNKKFSPANTSLRKSFANSFAT